MTVRATDTRRASPISPRFIPRTARAALSLALAALLAGCTSYAAPTLEVSGSELLDDQQGAMVVRLDIDAQNTNEVELPLREIRYTLSLDGREVFQGVRSPEASLRRLGTQSFSIPAVITYEGLSRPTGTHEFSLEGELLYVTPGEIAQILFDTGVRRPKVRFREAGTIDLGSGGLPPPSQNPAPPEAAPPQAPPGTDAN